MNDNSMREALSSTGPVERVVETVYATGYWLFGQERYADAAAVFRVLLQAAPEMERSWLALGECHERAGQLRLALELYTAGTVAAAPAPRCSLARARTLKALGRDMEADAAFDVARELAEDSDDATLVRQVDIEARAA